jgi:hypothetical protein
MYSDNGVILNARPRGFKHQEFDLDPADAAGPNARQAAER